MTVFKIIGILILWGILRYAIDKIYFVDDEILVVSNHKKNKASHFILNIIAIFLLIASLTMF
jgi:hypothetical protein